MRDGLEFQESLFDLLSTCSFLLSRSSSAAIKPREASQAYVVLDADDPTRPAELCVLELSGSW